MRDGSKVGKRVNRDMRPPARTNGYGAFAKNRESSALNVLSAVFFRSLTM